MAILTKFKQNVEEKISTAVDKSANLIAKASELSSEQLQETEKLRKEYMSKMPETSPEGIKRLLGAYAIEAYEAYLPQIASLYEPISMKFGDDETSLKNRIRYFEITKWVVDPSEDSLEKLINVYQVVSHDACNIALIYDRKKEGCKVYLAVVNTGNSDLPQIANQLEDRIVSAVKGNFPGVEFKRRNKQDKVFGSGVLPCLQEIDGISVAAVSNIATEKAENFLVQNMEKLLDGICPENEEQEYRIILLATPVREQLIRKNAMSELYSKLAPYASWQTNFTYTEMNAKASGAQFGACLGVTAGRQTGNVYTEGEQTSRSDTVAESVSHTDSRAETKSKSVGVGAGIGAGKERKVGKKKVPVNGNLNINANYTKSKTEGTADTRSKSKSVTDTIGKISSIAQNNGMNLGANFGVNFSRSSNVTVSIGKNEGLTQSFTNHAIKYTLEMIEKQIKRLEESSALGMWDFSAYFLSKSPTVANNAAQMYLALTQGNESYLSQAALNLWVPPIDTDEEYDKKKKQDISNIINYIMRLVHPQFQLCNINNENDDLLMYPPHVDTSVSLTGRELARALNFPKKSISGLPVLECVAFGREVHKYESVDFKEENISLGHVFHMHHDEVNEVEVDINSLTSHAFVTGSTGTGKSNMVYQLLDKVYDKNIPFMVIEPAKGEYKQYFGEDCRVYGTNIHETDLLYINPFSFPKEIHILEHIDRLVEILNACWPMYAAMPAVLKDAIERVYVNRGWDLRKSICYLEDTGKFPTFVNLLKMLPEVIEKSAYSSDTKSDYTGALMTRIKSLTNGLNGQLLCSGIEINEEELFETNVIIDLSRVGSMETRSLFMGILVLKLQEYHMSRKEMNATLKHLTILEEAHNLLRKTSDLQSQESANLQGKSVEMLTNSIAEMRTYGEGFVIVDQAPGLLDEAVIRNTNTKIILRLPDADDRELVGRSAALSDIQIKELAKLPRGVAAIYQNNWVEAVLCRFDKFENKRPYVNKMKERELPEDIFRNVFFVKEKIKTLKKEDVDSVFVWIDNLEYSEGIKRAMKKAILGAELSEREKQVVAYNIFGGNIVGGLLSGAVTEKEGNEKVKRYISNISNIQDVETINMIQQLIIRAKENNSVKSQEAGVPQIR